MKVKDYLKLKMSFSVLLIDFIPQDWYEINSNLIGKLETKSRNVFVFKVKSLVF